MGFPSTIYSLDSKSLGASLHWPPSPSPSRHGSRQAAAHSRIPIRSPQAGSHGSSVFRCECLSHSHSSGASWPTRVTNVDIAPPAEWDVQQKIDTLDAMYAHLKHQMNDSTFSQNALKEICELQKQRSTCPPKYSWLQTHANKRPG